MLCLPILELFCGDYEIRQLQEVIIFILENCHQIKIIFTWLHIFGSRFIWSTFRAASQIIHDNSAGLIHTWLKNSHQLLNLVHLLQLQKKIFLVHTSVFSKVCTTWSYCVVFFVCSFFWVCTIWTIQSFAFFFVLPETIKHICKSYYDKINQLEDSKYDLEYLVRIKDHEVRDSSVTSLHEGVFFLIIFYFFF